MNAELKEWVKVSHSPKTTTVTVSLVEGNLSVRWSVKTYSTAIKGGVREARAGATKALDELKIALAELDEAA